MRRSLLFSLALVTGGASASADRLTDTREVARGDYLAPRFSPDGRELLVTGPQLRGLLLATIGGTVRPLTDEAEAGVHARWLPDGTIAYRAPRAGMRRDLAITRDGRVTSHAAPAPVAFAQDDRVYVLDRSNKLVRIGSGDRFHGAVVSPDGDKVVFSGLVTGLHLYVRSTGTLRYIGPGTAPAWSPDSARIVFELTEDDGHYIVASDLYSYEVSGDRVERLTATERVIERRPSFSPDGKSLAYDDNAGAIFVGRLEVR